MRIETDRLILRNVKKGDEESVRKNINNLKISKWLLVVPYPYKRKDADWWINHCLKKQKKKSEKDYNFGITIKPSSEVIGGIGIKLKDCGVAEIGYWLGEKYWKKGYGYEAARAVVNFGFKKMKARKISIPIFRENPASNALARKLGAKLEGILRKQAICKATGKIHDENVYGLLKEEWKK